MHVACIDGPVESELDALVIVAYRASRAEILKAFLLAHGLQVLQGDLLLLVGQVILGQAENGGLTEEYEELDRFDHPTIHGLQARHRVLGHADDVCVACLDRRLANRMIVGVVWLAVRVVDLDFELLAVHFGTTELHDLDGQLALVDICDRWMIARAAYASNEPLDQLGFANCAVAEDADLDRLELFRRRLCCFAADISHLSFLPINKF